MATISGSVTIAGDPDDWIAVAWDADTHAYAGVATVSGGAYEITGLTAGKAYVVVCRPKTGAVWEANSYGYTEGSIIIPTDPETTPYIFKASDAPITDIYYADVKAIIACDGADESTTFTDEIGHTVTRSGNAQIDTAQSKFGGASAVFDGDGDRINVASSADFAWGTGDFCIEMWVRFQSDVHPGYFFSTPYDVGKHLYFSWDNSTNKIAAIGAGFSTVTQSDTVSADTWYHIAFTRNSGNTRLFVNGVAKGNGTSTANFSGNQGLYFGGVDSNIAGEGNWGKLHIDDIRVTNAARYWADFTPPTTAHPSGNTPTGSSEPTWPTTPGNTVVDGGVTWTNMGQMIRPLMQGPLIAA